MLRNRIYRGCTVHQGTAYLGHHEAIVDLELRQIVQDRLAAHWQERALVVGAVPARNQIRTYWRCNTVSG
jgi:hypothetical protein